MRKLLIFTLLICACNSYAGWFVFAVNETVERQTDQGWQILRKGDQLHPADSIRMSHYASLSVMDDKSKRVYSLQSPSPAQLADLMQQAQRTSPSNIARYWKTIQSIFRTGKAEERTGSAGVNYRDASADRMVAHLLLDQLNGQTWNNLPALDTDYQLELQVVSAESGELCHVLREGERVRFLVSNHSNRALFMAILDVDASGVPQVLLPMDAAEMISRAFVPAYSTVMLPEVLSFAPAGTDHLYLIAYDEPFDMEQVLLLMQSNESVTSLQDASARLGSAHLTVQIR